MGYMDRILTRDENLLFFNVLHNFSEILIKTVSLPQSLKPDPAQRKNVGTIICRLQPDPVLIICDEV